MTAETAATQIAPDSPAAKLAKLIANLEQRPVSVLSQHDAACCRAARAWFGAMARAAARGKNPAPRWITTRLVWGPIRWPLAWCEAVGRRELDCGALAALATAAFQAMGRSVFRVQLVEAYPPKQIAHWEARWARMPGAPRWIWDELVYHEEIGLIEESTIRLWNPTEGIWRDKEIAGGRVMALRLFQDDHARGRIHQEMQWGKISLPVGRWVSISSATG